MAISEKKKIWETQAKEFLKVPDFWILSFENIFWGKKRHSLIWCLHFSVFESAILSVEKLFYITEGTVGSNYVSLQFVANICKIQQHVY